jgi:transcription antitermination factor NusG
MEDYIHEIVVPTEEVAEIKNGQRKMVSRTVLPGYVLVRMDLTDESWAAVRHTPSVTGFVGHSHQPVPLSMAEVENMLAPAVVAAAEAEAPRRAGDRLASTRPRSRSRSPTSTSPTRSWSVARHVRHAPRDDHGDQRRVGSRSRRSSDLRPRDAGRAQLQPDPEV